MNKLLFIIIFISFFIGLNAFSGEFKMSDGEIKKKIQRIKKYKDPRITKSESLYFGDIAGIKIFSGFDGIHLNEDPLIPKIFIVLSNGKILEDYDIIKALNEVKYHPKDISSALKIAQGIISMNFRYSSIIDDNSKNGNKALQEFAKISNPPDITEKGGIYEIKIFVCNSMIHPFFRDNNFELIKVEIKIAKGFYEMKTQEISSIKL